MYLDPPRVSNFSPRVCFWWLRGSNFRPVEDLDTYFIYDNRCIYAFIFAQINRISVWGKDNLPMTGFEGSFISGNFRRKAARTVKWFGAAELTL